uniref:L1 transposable element RRM domain-containing protein n=1 Tax=Salarias fasciatus TaxID=181472 RepID=A0A672JM97_SALFA
MSKGKNTRGKGTSGLKIDQMLFSIQTRANDASPEEANASSSLTPVEEGRGDCSAGSASQTTSNDFAAFMGEIRNMYRELQDNVKKVGSDVSGIVVSIDFMKADLATFGTRLGEAEERVSQLEDGNARFENITGIPELSERDGRVLECVMDILRSLFPSSEDVKGIETERAHRVPVVRQEVRQDRSYGPRHVLVRFLRYVDREKVHARARDVGEFRWNCHKLDFSPDFSKEVQDKRSKFNKVRRMCMSKGLRYTLQYPAVFWVTLNGSRQRFEDAAAAKKCIERHQTADGGN